MLSVSRVYDSVLALSQATQMTDTGAAHTGKVAGTYMPSLRLDNRWVEYRRGGPYLIHWSTVKSAPQTTPVTSSNRFRKGQALHRVFICKRRRRGLDKV